ncbi:MAG: tape measure protein [Butyricicoccus sp.]
MALSNTVQLRDGMSNVLSRIASNLSTVNDRFERMQSLTEQAAPTGLYSQFNSELTGVREELTRTVSEVEELRSGMTSAQPPAENLTASLKKLGTAFLGSKLVSGIVSMSDEMTQTTARLNLMNDGLQSTADLQELIYQSAMRSRGAYNATADAVAKMGLLAGDAFSSNQETIAFVEQLNKQFKIAGTSAEGQAAAMLQITQAMGSGVLRGEELNSVFEQAPTIIQSIADYLGVSVSEIRSMAQEGELTASVVKSRCCPRQRKPTRSLARFRSPGRMSGRRPATWRSWPCSRCSKPSTGWRTILRSSARWCLRLRQPCAVCGGRQLDESVLRLRKR